VQGKVSREQRLYITSHEDKKADFIAHAIHSHWFVENKLHWQLDVIFNEDQNRLKSGYTAESFSMMNKIALNLLKNEKSVKVGVKTKRLKAAGKTPILISPPPRAGFNFGECLERKFTSAILLKEQLILYFYNA